MKYKKYPRTPHLPWSEQVSSDDKRLSSDDIFVGKEVVVTEKMDGENTSMYSDYIHARSLDSGNHESRNWVKNFWGQIRYLIPDGCRVCGENLFAKHSIFYNDLTGYFLGFSYWCSDECNSWDRTLQIFSDIGIEPVRCIYRGVYDLDRIHSAWDRLGHESEGYVIRLADGFSYDSFGKSVAKFVRKNHVQTDEHWKNIRMIPNRLRRT